MMTTMASRPRRWHAPAMPHVIVHTLGETCAALEAAAETGLPLTLYSPPDAVHSIGIGYFLAMIEAARRQTPATQSLAVLDCGAAPGLALAALRAGAEAVHLTGSPLVLDKVSDIAAQCGASLLREMPVGTLDLRGHPDPRAAASAFLLSEHVI